MKNILKVWLRKLTLTDSPNDYTAVVSYTGRIDKKGIIDAMAEEGVELKRETLEDVVNRYNRLCASFVLKGWTVDTGLVYMRAVVTGIFRSKKAEPETNSVYVSVTQGAEIRRQAAETGIEVLGETPDTMYILQVTNMQTKQADGTVMRGRNAMIEGAYIKIAGTDPAVGVYLINTEKNEEYKLSDESVVINDPSKLLVLLPAELPKAVVRLKIVTQYTKGKPLLKAPREAVYEQEITLL